MDRASLTIDPSRYGTGDTPASANTGWTPGDAEIMGVSSPASGSRDGVSDEKRAEAIERVARMAAQFKGELEERGAKRLDRRRSKTPHATDDALDEETLNIRSLHERVSPSMFATEPAVPASIWGSEDSAKPTKVVNERSVVIFDWDDTLFPTWFVQNVVTPCTPSLQDKEKTFPADSPFTEMLTAHANVLQSLLRMTSTIAHVVIITNALRPWVTASADLFLPDMHLEELLSDLGILVYYARESLEQQPLAKHEALRDAEYGVNVWSVTKRIAMKQCLRKIYGRANVRWNVVSVGDATYEVDALKDVIWCCDGFEFSPLCKTVKFMDDPNCMELGDQLRLLGAWLENIIALDDDFDLTTYDNWDDAGLGDRKQPCNEKKPTNKSVPQDTEQESAKYVEAGRFSAKNFLHHARKGMAPCKAPS